MGVNQFEESGIEYGIQFVNWKHGFWVSLDTANQDLIIQNLKLGKTIRKNNPFVTTIK